MESNPKIHANLVNHSLIIILIFFFKVWFKYINY